MSDKDTDAVLNALGDAAGVTNTPSEPAATESTPQAAAKPELSRQQKAALTKKRKKAEAEEAESVEEIADDDEIEQAQEALPEAEQGFGEEFGFTEDSADAGDMQEDDLLQGCFLNVGLP